MSQRCQTRTHASQQPPYSITSSATANKPAGKSSPSDIRRALVPRKPARRESPRHGLGAGGHLKELKDGLGAKSQP